MNIGAAACGLAMLLFLVFGIIFALLKGRAAMLISGFNTLSAKERTRHDTDALSGYREQDWMRNVPLYAISCKGLWS